MPNICYSSETYHLDPQDLFILKDSSLSDEVNVSDEVILLIGHNPIWIDKSTGTPHTQNKGRALLEKALTRMNEILHMQEVVHDDINQSYNIENEINNYRNQLKIHNMEDVNNKKYQYQDGVYYMDLVGESEKLGDYVLNVVQAVIEKKI